MDIEFPEVPAKSECSDDAVKNYPGTDAFLAEYKDFAEQVTPVTPCLPDVVSTSGFAAKRIPSHFKELAFRP